VVVAIASASRCRSAIAVPRRLLVQGCRSPPFPWSVHDLALLVTGALGISLVALTDTISTATSFAERQGTRVDGNREMIGTANIAAGLFQGSWSAPADPTAVAEKGRADSPARSGPE
jgi:MFS superfamily sulfate permease-like transporter